VRMAKFEASVRYRMDSHIIVPFGQDIQLPGPPPEIPVELKSDEVRNMRDITQKSSELRYSLGLSFC